MRLGINIMPPETINSFFTPVSTETNPHQQIDDLILMSELDKIAREDMTYGAMRQYGTVEVTEAPGLGLLEWVDTGPIVGMKALAGLVGKGGKKFSKHRRYAKKLQNTAKKIFGTTDDATEAGYILDDGSMLDFSGKAEGGTRGMRAYDHRQINQVGDSGVGGLDEFDDVGMFEFITHGGIRWTPEMNAIEIGSKPSEVQINSLKKVYQDMRNRHNKFQTKYAQGGSTFTVEATMPSNQERFYGVILDENRLYKEYDFTAPWETVERDIRQFYKTGKGPSITQQFHR